MVLPLALATIYNPAKPDVQYQKLTGQYSSARPITRRLERERDALYGVAVSKNDLKKVRVGITFIFRQAQ